MTIQRARIPILLTLGALAGSTGCSALEAAAEITIGNPDIPRMDQAIEWPSIDELTGLSDQTLAAIPGFPSSLNSGTFAHLQGAMAIAGKCVESQDLSDAAGDRVNTMLIEISSFSDDPLCADNRAQLVEDNCDDPLTSNEAYCDENFRGMTFYAEINAELIGDEEAAAIEEQLTAADVKPGPESIPQIRLQFFQLELQQVGEGDVLGSINDKLSDFQLIIGNSNPEHPDVTVIEHRWLEGIGEETPQRFDIDGNSKVMQKLKTDVLNAERTDLSLKLKMAIDQDDLYSIGFEGGGVAIGVQPEVTISVLEIAKTKL